MDVDQEILALISRLGHHELNEEGFEIFLPERRPVKTLKDIRRLLNKDIEDADDFSSRTLLDVHAIRLHLIPLLLASAEHESSEAIVDEITKLFVLLTLPDTPKRESHAAELRAALVDQARYGQAPLTLLVSRIESALGVDASKRSEEDRKRIDLLLYLVRNLLLPSEQELCLAEFIVELEKEAVLDILVHYTLHISRKNNRDWNLLLLDIYFHLFRGVEVKALLPKVTSQAGVRSKESNVATNAMPTAKLSEALAELREQKRQLHRGVASRHSNFGGVFKVINEGNEKVVPSIFRSLDGKRITAQLLPNSIAQRKRRVQDASVVSRDVLSVSKSKAFFTGEVSIKALKKVADDLVDRGYSSLFQSLIQDFRREDARIKPDDEVRFIWMIQFFSQYARERGNWEASSLMTTMDLWSFQYVLNKIASSFELKAWAFMETCIGALVQMMSNLKAMTNDDESKKMKNAIFYEVRERLEIVPRLIKLWEPAVLTRECLKSLVSLADQILDIVEDMAEEGALAKARTKARIKEERKQKATGVFNLKWSAEETYALSEGVKARRGACDLAAMREILKDPSVGPVFEDQKRTPQQLVARWIQVKAALANGTTLEAFINEDLAKEEAEDKADDAQAEAETTATSFRDKQVDFFGALRSYLSNNIYRNLTRLVDPALHPGGGTALLRDVESQELVCKFFKRLRAFKKGLRGEESLEPLLWHVEILDGWQRFLLAVGNASPQSVSQVTKELVDVMLSSLRRLFRLAEKNHLVLLELLFWRTKHDNIVMSRAYKDRKAGRSPHVEDPSGFEDLHEAELEELDRLEDAESSNETDEEASFGEHSDKEEKVKKSMKEVTEAKAPRQLVKLSPKKNNKRKHVKQPPKAKKEALNTKKESLVINISRAKRAISLACRTGAPSQVFLALVSAFESAEPSDDAAPFIPQNMSAEDATFKSKEVMRVMIELGLRPPNRLVPQRTKTRFTCETYWRLPTNRMDKTALSNCAETIREAMVDDTDTGEDFEVFSDVEWCMDGSETNHASSSNSNSEESGDEDDEEIREDDEKMSVDQNSEEVAEKAKRRSQGRRVVVSSSGESDESEEEKDDEDDSKSFKPAEETNETKDEQIISKKRRIVIDDDDD